MVLSDIEFSLLRFDYSLMIGKCTGMVKGLFREKSEFSIKKFFQKLFKAWNKKIEKPQMPDIACMNCPASKHLLF